MMNRRALLMTLTAGVVAGAVLVAPAIADELLGVITKVNVEGKKLTVEEKESGKEIEVTVTDDTKLVTKDGEVKVDLAKVETIVKKRQDAGKKGVNAKIEHEKGVASKIQYQMKKAAAPAN